MPFPFEVSFDGLESDLDTYVDAVFGCLESEFLVMPKGKGFVEFPVFEYGYEALKRGTGSFRNVTPDTIASVVFETPIALVVLRCMLGFTPPEWAYYTSRHTGVEITQGAARTIDRHIRMDPEAPLPKEGSVTEGRIRALIAATCHALESGVRERAPARSVLRLLSVAFCLKTRTKFFSRVRSCPRLSILKQWIVVPYAQLKS